MAEPRDSASKISPEWLNKRTQAIRKRHQKHFTGKGTLASLLLPLNPRLSRVSLADYRKRFSFVTAGARYHKHLGELWAQREATAARLLWRRH